MSHAALEISRLCRKPDLLSGNRDRWQDFRLDMTNYMAATDENYFNDMRTAASMTEECEDHNDAALRQRSVVL